MAMRVSPGIAESSGVTAASTSSGGDKLIEKRLESLVLGENPEEAASTLNLKVSITKPKNPGNPILTNVCEKGENPTDLKVNSTEQHQKSKIQSFSTATIALVKHAPKQAVTKIDTTERQKSQLLKYLVEATTTPANPASVPNGPGRPGRGKA